MVRLLLLVGLVSPSLPGSLELFAEGTETPREQVGEEIIVPKNAKPADLTVKTTEWRSIIRAVNECLADRPDGSKARVILRREFSNHPAHYGVQAYPHAVVPLNEKGEPDGIERNYGVGTSGHTPARTVNWKNGKRHGEEKVHVGGKLKAVIPWVNDKVHGVRKTFYPDGKVQVESTYKNGEANGPTRSFDPQGRLTREELRKNGKRHGTVRDFWPDTGKVKREIHYKMGSVIGVTKDYYADGRLKRELPFKRNAMHGIEIQYTPEGEVIRERYWRDGEVVTKEQFGGE